MPTEEDDIEWIVGYLTFHSMSDNSRRYGYILWIIIAVIFLAFTLLHWSGSRGGFVGAIWSRWSLRKRTWRKKHSLAIAKKDKQRHHQPLLLPSNAQLLCLSILLLGSIILSVAGPDYIAPTVRPWHRRQLNADGNLTHGATMDLKKLTQPLSTIQKEWWTAAGRTGLIAFALLPLCVLFVLKAPPFAIFAMPFMIQIYSDKLSWLHRWSGRLIWLMSALHVLLWTLQLVHDEQPGTGQKAFVHAIKLPRFICGWIVSHYLFIKIV